MRQNLSSVNTLVLLENALRPFLDGRVVVNNKTSSHGLLANNVNIYETDSSYFIEAALPDVKQERVSLTIEGKRLTLEVSAAEQLDSKQTYLLNERKMPAGCSQRTFAFVDQLDSESAVATMADGLLRVRVDKKVNPEKKVIKITN